MTLSCSPPVAPRSSGHSLARLLSVAPLATVGLLSLAAFDPPPAPKFEITVTVSSDPGRPMANASITGAGKELGKTGADGKVTLALAAREGESLDVLVTCPKCFVDMSVAAQKSGTCEKCGASS